MINPISSAMSALQAIGRKVGVSANNIANLNTPGFKKNSASNSEIYDVKGADGGDRLKSAQDDSRTPEASDVDLAEEMANLTILKRSYQANLKVIETEDEMKGDVLDIIS